MKFIIIGTIIKSSYSRINVSLVIKSDFAVHVFCRNVEMNTIGRHKIP